MIIFKFIVWRIIMASLGNNYSNDLSHKDANSAELMHNQSVAINNLHTSHHCAVSWGAVLAGTASVAQRQHLLLGSHPIWIQIPKVRRLPIIQ